MNIPDDERVDIPWKKSHQNPIHIPQIYWLMSYVINFDDISVLLGY